MSTSNCFPSCLQTKFGQLFLKKRTLSGRNGADEVEAVLVELTNDHLVVRTKEEGRPLNEDALIKEVSRYYSFSIKYFVCGCKFTP